MLGLTVTELVIAGMFVAEVLEVLRHGNIFEDYRAKLEAGAYGHPDRFHVRLLSCMFCLTVWVVGAVVLFLAARPYLHSVVNTVGSFLILTGAIARASNILHDLVRPFSRTPNSSARTEAHQKFQMSLGLHEPITRVLQEISTHGSTTRKDTEER